VQLVEFIVMTDETKDRTVPFDERARAA
jgi:hypothetical protein